MCLPTSLVQVGNAYGVATIVKADFAGLPVVKVFYNGELRLSYGSIAFSGLLVQDLLVSGTAAGGHMRVARAPCGVRCGAVPTPA